MHFRAVRLELLRFCMCHINGKLSNRAPNVLSFGRMRTISPNFESKRVKYFNSDSHKICVLNLAHR